MNSTVSSALPAALPELTDLSQSVRNKESFGDLPVVGQPSHIAFGIDANYARCMGVLMASIRTCNPSLPVVFHVFTDSIRAEDRQRLADLAETQGLCIHIYYINSAAVQSFPASSHYSTAVYYRILMPAILQSSAERVLYLDSDIVCIGSLPGLDTLDLAGKSVAAVRDVPRVAAEKQQELKLRHADYFNSGVMIIDVASWNAANLSQQVLTVLSENKGNFSLVDQDALNIVLDGKIAILPPAWNQIYDMGQMTHDPLAETIFLHYTGSVKPWRLAGRHRLSEYYRRQEARSPWAGLPLLAPANYKEMEIYARLSLKAGDIVTALAWYGKYLWAKFGKR